MSVAALKREIASLHDYGHLHVVDARILTSPKILGQHVSKDEFQLLAQFKDDVDSGYITSSPDSRAVLDAIVAAGPTGMGSYAGSVAVSALKWGAGLALVGCAVGVLAPAVTGGAGGSAWTDLAMVAGGMVGAGVGAGTGLLVGTYRAARD